MELMRASDQVMAVKQKPMNEHTKFSKAMVRTPPLKNWQVTNGGPVYVSVGSQEEIGDYLGVDEEKFSFTSSYSEFYYYRQPIIKKIYPHGGPIEGGTEIVIEGAWFDFIPEYGVVPHCKIGSQVSKAVFESSVRILCITPPGNTINQLLPVSVSLNGVDFIGDDQNQTFHYYEHSKLTGISPPSGPNTGGTAIRLFGTQFSGLSTPEEFKC